MIYRRRARRIDIFAQGGEITGVGDIIMRVVTLSPVK